MLVIVPLLSAYTGRVTVILHRRKNVKYHLLYAGMQRGNAGAALPDFGQFF